MNSKAVFTNRRNVGQGERVVSVAAGAGLILFGARRGRPIGWLLALLGGEMVRRGATGWCPLYEALGANTEKGPLRPVMFERSVTVQVDAPALYGFWRNVENLPRVMRHVESVQRIDDQHSHWTARVMGLRLEWDAVIVADIENELIGWRSLPGSSIENAGSVHFAPAPGGGTEVTLTVTYRPPAGLAGKAAALAFKSLTEDRVADDLRDLKRLLEPGSAAADLPRGGREIWQ